MSKTKFKVGDRVAVYNPHRELGVITKVEEIFIDVMLDDNTYSRMFHPKQLRRLKPRKPKAESMPPREWVLHTDYSGTVVFSGAINGNPISCTGSDKLVHVTELPPGSAVVTRESLAKAWDEYVGNTGDYLFRDFCKALNLPLPKDKE